MEYIALPFILQKGYLARTNLYDSIAHSVGLILSTRIGMMGFDREFGCEIWAKEYSDLYSIDRGDIRASLRNAISKYEKRLLNVSVSFVNISTVASRGMGMVTKITGKYFDGNREKEFEMEYNLS